MTGAAIPISLGQWFLRAPPSQMKHPRSIAFATAGLFIVLWAVPLARAIFFIHWAQNYLRVDMTLNAANDLHYSTWLLACYAVSLLTAYAFAWLLFWRPTLWSLLPGAWLAFAAVEVIWLHPEMPIHLFWAMVPWRPAIISVVSVAIAATFGHLAHTVCQER